MSEDRDRGVTIWFDCDVKQFKDNPLLYDTPFGKPVIMGLGNVFTERDDLEEKIQKMEDDAWPR